MKHRLPITHKRVNLSTESLAAVWDFSKSAPEETRCPVIREATIKIAVPAAMTENRITYKVCPKCGFHEKDFAKNLHLGCSHCYVVFAPELATFLPRMHVGITHVGKIPRAIRDEARQLETALKEVEHLLASNLSSDASDALLDQWRELATQLEASGKTIENTP